MLEELKELLYVENEYGYQYQDPEAVLPEELVNSLATEYGIRTNVHRTCVNCQLRQLSKYGENKIKCNFIAKGLPKGSMSKAKQIATQSGIPLKRAIQIMLATIDPVAWAELMFGFEDSDKEWNIRGYQKEQIRCTANRTVVREGRRSGKTFAMALKILYYVFNLQLNKGRDSSGKLIKSGPNIMIVTPYQAQVANIFTEIESLLKRNQELTSSCTTDSGGSLYVKTPFFRMEFELAGGAKAKISGFVSGTGVKQDGSGGGVMRGQSADIVYLDEMDMIPEEVLEAVVTPILLTRPDTIMLSTSTPIGEKGKFYDWCTNRPEYKEDYYPSTVLPHWDQIKEELEAESTKDGFTAEYMAAFPDNVDGVFKMSWIKKARLEYDYSQMVDPIYLRNITGISDPSNMIKSIGIDWNKNAGTEFYVLGYSASKGCWITLEAVNVPASEYSAKKWAAELIRLNYKWKPDHIYADEGYGHTIIEDLKLHSYKIRSKKSKNQMDKQTALIADRLVSFNFSRSIKLKSPIDGQTIVKSGKHYLVENIIRAMEDNKFYYSINDESFTKQLQNYTIVRRQPNTGKAVYGMEKKSIGDHRLDAAMLALAALTLEESVYAKGKIPYSTPGLVTRKHAENASFSSPHEDTRENLSALSKAGLPGAIEVLKLMRGNGSEEEDRAIKEKYKKQGLWKKETSNKKRRGDILSSSQASSTPSILESINKQTNQFSKPKRSGPKRSRRGSRSWKK
jgi:hypothetical protein